MSGLTKKQIYVDKNLSTVLGISEGELVSYSDIQKLLHKYIKDNDLRKLGSERRPSTQPVPPETRPAGEAGLKPCRDCGANIPAEAIFCDLCGVRQ